MSSAAVRGVPGIGVGNRWLAMPTCNVDLFLLCGSILPKKHCSYLSWHNPQIFLATTSSPSRNICTHGHVDTGYWSHNIPIPPKPSGSEFCHHLNPKLGADYMCWNLVMGLGNTNPKDCGPAIQTESLKVRGSRSQSLATVQVIRAHTAIDPS